MSSIYSNPQPNRSGAGWRVGQQQRVSQVVGGLPSTPTGPAALVLGTAGAQSAGTLTVTAQASVTLGAAVAQSAATLALTAQTKIALSAAVVGSAATMVVSIPVVGPVYPGGKFVLRNATVVVAGTNVSSVCRAVTVTQSKDEIEITGYGDPYHVYLPGSSSAEFQVDLFADPQVITPALWATFDAAAPVWVEVTPKGLPQSSTNPKWSAFAVPTRKKQGGAVGEAATATLELHSTGEVFETF